MCLAITIWNKNHLLKQAAPITYTPGNKFSEAATFEGFFSTSFFKEIEKNCSITWFV